MCFLFRFSIAPLPPPPLSLLLPPVYSFVSMPLFLSVSSVSIIDGGVGVQISLAGVLKNSQNSAAEGRVRATEETLTGVRQQVGVVATWLSWSARVL